MKISVVTVAFNSGATIAGTLRSVAEQSHPDVEHIVIDGGSSDDTMAQIRRYGGRVSRCISEPDGGIYDAMNKGLRYATGAFVGFLNADDLFADAEVVADIARAGGPPSVDAVFGDLVYVERDQPSRVVRYWHAGRFATSRLRFGWMPPHPTLYVRTARIAELGLFDTRMRIAADYDFILRYLRDPGGRVEYVSRVLVRMRVGGASNRSLGAIANKSREDLTALRVNGVGGVLSLLCKNVRKLPQLRWSWQRA